MGAGWSQKGVFSSIYTLSSVSVCNKGGNEARALPGALYGATVGEDDSRPARFRENKPFAETMVKAGRPLNTPFLEGRVVAWVCLCVAPVCGAGALPVMAPFGTSSARSPAVGKTN